MRKTKRFTPAVLDRFRAEGRGTGVLEDYCPWHCVGRSDPSSRGRSHLVAWRDRQRHLLSDLEWVACCFSLMLPHLLDLREQFPLSLESARHELAAYDIGYAMRECPGTIELAEDRRMRHPKVHGQGRSEPWVMTTDLLLTLRRPRARPELLAVSCKFDKELDSARAVEKLQLEQDYWRLRDVPWLLLTPKLYEESVALTLRHTMPEILSPQVPPHTRCVAASITDDCWGHSLTLVLQRIASQLGDLDLAKRAFWQSVWSGEILLDLRRGWRPHVPISPLARSAFTELNPIASRRSSWNA